jgi:Tfp pilus assembly protein PilF
VRAVAMALVLCLAGPGAAADAAGDAESRQGCFGEEMSSRIQACTALIESNDLSEADRALAYSARALAYAVSGKYDLAIPDYDASLRIDPESAIALNNRAWAYVRSGTPERGADDVEKALALAPASPQTLDTRAHIYQSRGDTQHALRDYEEAIRIGGRDIIKLYQCGLQAQSLFAGDIDGLYSTDMRRALETCVATTGCDPLPADEECRKVTS